MKKKKLFFSSLLMLMSVGMAHGQTAYAYVQKSGTVVTADGTASYAVESKDAEMSFDSEGNAIMTYNGQTVAKITSDELTNGGELAADFTSSTNAGTITKTVESGVGYATFYSPFQVQLPSTLSEVEVYSPTCDNKTVHLNNTTKVAASAVIPAGTAVVLKNAGDITFTFSSETPTVSVTSDNVLKGVAIDETITASSVLTLGKGTISQKYGFYLYTGTTLYAGKAYLETSYGNAKAVMFSFDDEVTAVNNVNALTGSAQALNGKFIENGRVVILKNNKKYNLNGQEVK